MLKSALQGLIPMFGATGMIYLGVTVMSFFIPGKNDWAMRCLAIMHAVLFFAAAFIAILLLEKIK